MATVSAKSGIGRVTTIASAPHRAKTRLAHALPRFSKAHNEWLASSTDTKPYQGRARTSHKREESSDLDAKERTVGNQHHAGGHRQPNVGHQ
ncbi:MAG: hypothetical protein M3441_27835 [Chloroflexota bacterium]|nr:hypothetical protein [Chloroflexota bacterium]